MGNARTAVTGGVGRPRFKLSLGSSGHLSPFNPTYCAFSEPEIVLADQLNLQCGHKRSRSLVDSLGSPKIFHNDYRASAYRHRKACRLAERPGTAYSCRLTVVRHAASGDHTVSTVVRCNGNRDSYCSLRRPYFPFGEQDFRSCTSGIARRRIRAAPTPYQTHRNKSD